MKTTIFYFTGTGNSLKIARDIAKELGDTDVVPAARAVKHDLNIPAGRVGFIFPVYAFTVPLIVRDLIEKLKVSPGTYIFGVTDCADVAANVLDQLAAILSKKGLKLSAGFVIKMPSNFTPFGGALPEEKQAKIFDKEAVRVREIAGIIKDNRACKPEVSGLAWRLVGKAISYLMPSMMRKEDKNFWVTDSCNGCGTCVKVCPVDNIVLREKKPVWQHRCEQCFACLQWCPKEAIQYGKSTKGRKRYHNPEITLQDMFQGK